MRAELAAAPGWRWLLLGLLLGPAAGQQPAFAPHEDYRMYRSAFSAAECETIAAIFLKRPPELDTRTIPLLPNMHDEFRVSRLSRFDDGTLMSRGQLDFIYDRLVGLQQGELPSPLFAIAGLDLQRPQNATSEWAATARQRLRTRIGFNMIHEFNSASQANPQFDWHADTKPGDGKRRRRGLPRSYQHSLRGPRPASHAHTKPLPPGSTPAR